jgi:hypothetical protein
MNIMKNDSNLLEEYDFTNGEGANMHQNILREQMLSSLIPMSPDISPIRNLLMRHCGHYFPL